MFIKKRNVYKQKNPSIPPFSETVSCKMYVHIMKLLHFFLHLFYIDFMTSIYMYPFVINGDPPPQKKELTHIKQKDILHLV